MNPYHIIVQCPTPCATCGKPATIGERDGSISCADCHCGNDHLSHPQGHVNGDAERSAMTQQ